MFVVVIPICLKTQATMFQGHGHILDWHMPDEKALHTAAGMYFDNKIGYPVKDFPCDGVFPCHIF
jgi:hypothetical protein